MDRRTRVGQRVWAGLLLSGLALPTSAWGMAPQRDPDALGQVGTVPIEPIDAQLRRGQADDPAAALVTDPRGRQSLDPKSQPATSGLGWFARRRAAAQAKAKANASANAGLPGRTLAGPRAGRPPVAGAPIDPLTVPAGLGWAADSETPAAPSGRAATAGESPDPAESGLVSPNDRAAAGRPAPFAGQAPAGPRPQALAPTLADPDDALMGGTPAVLGRPAPQHTSTPDRPRPSRDPDPRAAARPRPQLPALGAGSAPSPGPGPVIPATLPDLDTDHTPEPIPPPLAAGPAPDISQPASTPSPLDLPDTSAPADLPTITPPAAPAVPDSLPAVNSGVEVAASRPATGGPAGIGPPPEGFPTELLAADSGASSGATEGVTPAPIVAPLPPTVPSGASPGTPEPEPRPGSIGDATAIRVDPRVRAEERPLASACAARVGETIITMNQVESMVVERFKQVTEGQTLSKEDRDEALNMLGQQALEYLIEQELILLNARHKIKDAKFKAHFDELANKTWAEKELPYLLRKYQVANEFDLKRKLAAEGKSYSEMKDRHADQMLMHQFLYTQIRGKVPPGPTQVDLMEARIYYNKHLAQYELPARISWRELEVDAAKYPDRVAARRAAEALHARIARGEDFAAVARSASDGVTANQGGLWADRTPGDYRVAPVNAALGSLPVGQVSPVIEAPDGFHIVRVESRRAAGPRPFPEVQAKIQEAVFNEAFDKARTAYIARLRAETLVRVSPLFQSAAHPGGPTADPAVRAASAR